MKVSVIIATYNYGKYLKGAIDSVLNQNYDSKEYEILVVFRESGDNSYEILKRYEAIPNIKVIKQNGTGLANACNIGLQNASGEYFIRLDADDVFNKELLLVESLILDTNQELDFVYPDYVNYLEGKGVRIRKHLPPFDREELAARGEFLGGGTMFRRSLFSKIGNYDESLEILHDYEYILRMLKHNILGYHIRLPLFEYRIHDDSMSNQTELVYNCGKKISARYGRQYMVGENHPRKIGQIR